MPDWGKLRNDFGVNKNYIYLDNGAKVPYAKPVKAAIQECIQLCETYGRDYGQWWQTADSVRSQAADLLGATPEEICYAGSSTHAVNMVAQGIRWKPGDNMVVYENEFPSNLYPWLKLMEKGVDVRLVTADMSGGVPLERYEALCDNHTRLIAVSHVQAGSGYRADLNRFGDFCRSKGILYFVDATQSCGLFPIQAEEMNIDFLCASTYKWMMGMDGLAVLYCRKSRIKDIEFSYLGWSGRTDRNDYQFHHKDYPEEARRYELGNLNYTAIIALEAALKYQKSIGTLEIMQRTISLTDYLKKGLEAIKGIQISGEFDETNRGALITFHCKDFELIHRNMTEKGILSSLRFNGIRFSPYFYNTFEDIDRALVCLADLVEANNE